MAKKKKKMITTKKTTKKTVKKPIRKKSVKKARSAEVKKTDKTNIKPVVKIILVDDHKIFREGLKTLLMDEKEIKIIGECEDGDEVAALLKSKTPDVVFLDLNMKRVGGLAAIKIIKEVSPHSKIIILSMHNEYSFISESIQNGASGYILKNTTKHEILKAIKYVMNYDTYYAQEVSSVLVSDFFANKKVEEEFKVTPDELTSRELEIVNLISKEYKSSDIAGILNMSVRTVEAHRRNLLSKIGVKNTVGVIKFALYYHLVE